jgi:hypothetical protein
MPKESAAITNQLKGFRFSFWREMIHAKWSFDTVEKALLKKMGVKVKILGILSVQEVTVGYVPFYTVN